MHAVFDFKYTCEVERVVVRGGPFVPPVPVMGPLSAPRTDHNSTHKLPVGVIRRDTQIAIAIIHVCTMLQFEVVSQLSVYGVCANTIPSTRLHKKPDHEWCASFACTLHGYMNPHECVLDICILMCSLFEGRSILQ